MKTTPVIPSMLDEIFRHARERQWPIDSLSGYRMEDPPPPPTPPTDPPAPTDPPEEPTYPANTPIIEMTPPQQAAYWKAQSRKHESRANARADYDDLKKKADEHDALLKTTQTEQEKAIELARKEAADEATSKSRTETSTKLVTAEMRIAAAGRIEPDRLKALLEPLDLTKFLTAEGEVDEAKVTEYVASIAPVKEGDGKTKTPFPKLGQGRQSSADTATPARGAERYAERHKKTAQTT